MVISTLASELQRVYFYSVLNVKEGSYKRWKSVPLSDYSSKQMALHKKREKKKNLAQLSLEKCEWSVSFFSVEYTTHFPLSWASPR